MFSLVVLFTLFLGLVGVLVVFSEWQKKRAAARAGDAATNLLLLHNWLADHGCHAPTPEEAIHVLNKAACQRAKSEDWSNLEVSGLLPHTLPPEFSVNSVEFHSNECFFVGRVTWSRCTPGVRVVTEVEGVGVTYNMQFDYLLAEVRVCLALREGGLLVSMEHITPPQMAISCAVLSPPHVKEPESLASSVADGVQQLLMNLRLSDVMVSRPVPPSETGGQVETNNIGGSSPLVPTVLVSAPEEVEEEEERQDSGTGEEEEDSGRREKEEDSGMGEEGEEREEGTAPENGRNEKLDFPVKEESSDCVANHQYEGGDGGAEKKEEDERKSEAGSTASDRGRKEEEEEEEEEEGGNSEMGSTVSAGDSRKEEEKEKEQPPAEDALDSPSSPPSSSQLPAIVCGDGTPPSLRWRRSPSYEQLQEMVFSSSPTSSLSRPNPRRSHTLSLSGSDVFRDDQRYSSDDQLPSTLVFEVNGPRVRHIVALSPAHASKLRRRLSHATKLHIYNDHVFIATHFKQRQKLCAVCQEKISGTFGKQGYSCRDCEMVVHKHCHYKIEKVCAHSTVSTMNLIYPESVSTVSSM